MFSVKAKTVDLKRQELKTKEIDQDSFDALVQGEESKRTQWIARDSCLVVQCDC